MKNIKIYFKNNAIKPMFSIFDETITSNVSLGTRIVEGGFIVLSDNRWETSRDIIVNLSEVACLVIE